MVDNKIFCLYDEILTGAEAEATLRKAYKRTGINCQNRKNTFCAHSLKMWFC